jgi:hypothetical protein
VPVVTFTSVPALGVEKLIPPTTNGLNPSKDVPDGRMPLKLTVEELEVAAA